MQIQSHLRSTPLASGRSCIYREKTQASAATTLPCEKADISEASRVSTKSLALTGESVAKELSRSLQSQTPEPGSQLQTTPLKRFNRNTNPAWASKLTDIMQHEAPGDHNPYNDLITKGHETIHGIDNWLMNNGQPPDGGDGRWHLQSGFYLGDDKSVVIWEPAMRKNQVGAHVPRSLRGMRYAHYVEGAREWDEHPLYIWQEWNAYIHGTEVGINQKAEGKWTAGRRIASLGPLEFTVYSLATSKAIKRHDPDRWNSDPQLREFTAERSKAAMEVALAAQATPEFKNSDFDAYLNNFRTSPDAASLRQFAKDEFGEKFCREVYGF